MTPLSYAVSGEAASEFDDSLMVATFAACTPCVDHEAEITDPSGLCLDYHRANPIWLFAHDKSSLPVGKAEAPDGRYAVWLDGDVLRAKCYFSQANPVGPTLYAMFKERTLRGCSIGFRPRGGVHLSEQESKSLGADRRVYKHTVADLLEISIAPIPMNPEALGEAVSRGFVGGERIPEGLLRKLKAWLPEAKSLTLAVTPSRQATAADKMGATDGTNSPAPGPSTKAAKMDETMDDPAVLEPEAEAAGGEPDDALWGGFTAAITAILDKYKAGDHDAVAAAKEIGKYIKAHSKLTAAPAEKGDEEPAETEDKADDDEDDSELEEPSDTEEKALRDRMCKALDDLAAKVDGLVATQSDMAAGLSGVIETQTILLSKR